MTPKRLSIAVGGLALLAVLALGLAQLSGRGRSAQAGLQMLTEAQMQQRLAGSPAPLAALHAQGGALLGGGAPALRARLASLRGWPVVVNKWASWCVPCRSERAVFQHAAVDWGRRVAFLGVDSGDTSRADALAFLRARAVSYPSYYDASGRLGASVTDSSFTPVTVFYDSRGSRYIHQGPYLGLAQLERDVRRYALHA